MSDVQKRLREAHPTSAQYTAGSNLLLEAADEIERYQMLLVNLDDTAAVHLKLPCGGLPDSTDNDGNPYQSAWAQQAFHDARKAVTVAEPQEEQ